MLRLNTEHKWAGTKIIKKTKENMEALETGK